MKGNGYLLNKMNEYRKYDLLPIMETSVHGLAILLQIAN